MRVAPVMCAICVAAVGLRSPARAAFTELAGDLPSKVTAGKGPYLVTADVYVPSGERVVIEAGTVFLFKNFTGLHVEGVVIADGSRLKPVTFTSEFDNTYNPGAKLKPNPYDWNGIYIHEDAIGSELRHIRLQYSVYGVHSKTKFIKIVEGVFSDNGRGNVSIEGTEQDVAAEPFTYTLSVKDATVDGVPARILRDPSAIRRNVLRYSGLAVLLGGSVAGVYFTNYYLGARKDVDDLSSRDLDNLINHTDSDWRTARDRRNRNLTLLSAGFGTAVLGAVGFTVSFAF